MRSLVTGATGYLGRELTCLLADRHGPGSITALVADPLPEPERDAATELAARGVALVPIDLLALPVGRLPAVPFDVLFHLAAETDSAAPPERLAVNTNGFRHLLETLGAEGLAGRRVILAGATAAVDRARRPRGLLREDDPPAPRTAYGASKLEQERILADYAREWGFGFAIPRLSPVWEESLSTGFLAAFREQAERRSILRRVAWPGRITMIRRDDAARILVGLGESGAADGGPVHVGDGQVYRYRDLLRDLRRRAGDRGWFLPVPGPLWALVRWAAWLPVLRRLVPWRLSCLLGDDLAVDAARLDALDPAPRHRWPPVS